VGLKKRDALYIRYEECFVKFSTTKSKLIPTTLRSHPNTKKPNHRIKSHGPRLSGNRVQAKKEDGNVLIIIPFPAEIQDDLWVETQGP
jgi:hypothetical protein